MNQTVSDIKRPFLDVYKALDTKTQRKAMKGAMRREGNRLKKAAVANLSSSGIGKGTKRSLSSGIYVRTYPDRYGLGFMVSVKPHGKRKGIHMNRQSKEKPVRTEPGIVRQEEEFLRSSERAALRARRYVNT